MYKIITIFIVSLLLLKGEVASASLNWTTKLSPSMLKSIDISSVDVTERQFGKKNHYINLEKWVYSQKGNAHWKELSKAISEAGGLPLDFGKYKQLLKGLQKFKETQAAKKVVLGGHISGASAVGENLLQKREQAQGFLRTVKSASGLPGVQEHIFGLVSFYIAQSDIAKQNRINLFAQTGAAATLAKFLDASKAIPNYDKLINDPKLKAAIKDIFAEYKGKKPLDYEGILKSNEKLRDLIGDPSIVMGTPPPPTTTGMGAPPPPTTTTGMGAPPPPPTTTGMGAPPPPPGGGMGAPPPPPPPGGGMGALPQHTFDQHPGFFKSVAEAQKLDAGKFAGLQIAQIQQDHDKIMEIHRLTVGAGGDIQVGEFFERLRKDFTLYFMKSLGRDDKDAFKNLTLPIASPSHISKLKISEGEKIAIAKESYLRAYNIVRKNKIIKAIYKKKKAKAAKVLKVSKVKDNAIKIGGLTNSGAFFYMLIKNAAPQSPKDAAAYGSFDGSILQLLDLSTYGELLDKKDLKAEGKRYLDKAGPFLDAINKKDDGEGFISYNDLLQVLTVEDGGKVKKDLKEHFTKFIIKQMFEKLKQDNVVPPTATLEKTVLPLMSYKLTKSSLKKYLPIIQWLVRDDLSDYILANLKGGKGSLHEGMGEWLNQLKLKAIAKAKGKAKPDTSARTIKRKFMERIMEITDKYVDDRILNLTAGGNFFTEPLWMFDFEGIADSPTLVFLDSETQVKDVEGYQLTAPKNLDELPNRLKAAFETDERQVRQHLIDKSSGNHYLMKAPWKHVSLKLMFPLTNPNNLNYFNNPAISSFKQNFKNYFRDLFWKVINDSVKNNYEIFRDLDLEEFKGSIEVDEDYKQLISSLTPKRTSVVLLTAYAEELASYLRNIHGLKKENPFSVIYNGSMPKDISVVFRAFLYLIVQEKWEHGQYTD